MNNLVDRVLAAAQPKSTVYSLPDGNGLSLRVQPNAKKLWYFKYIFVGKQRMMGLGVYPEVSLREARDRRDQYRRMLRDGIDPLEHRRGINRDKAESVSTSFASVTGAWLQKWRPGVKARTAAYVERRLEQDVLPALGDKSVENITKAQVLEALDAVHGRGAIDISRRLFRTLRQIFKYAIARGLMANDPIANVETKVLFPKRKVKNFARIDEAELPELLRRIGGYAGHVTTQVALKLMVLTFVRTSELINARWAEFDLDADKPVWRIPAERMKMGKPHIVPLSKQAVVLLRELHTHSGHRAILFPGQRDHDKCMSNNTLLMALDRLGYKGRMTGHGFRGLASTILHELGVQPDHIEAQLAHEQRNRVAAAYNRASWLSDRELMMQRWADYLDECKQRRPRAVSEAREEEVAHEYA